MVGESVALGILRHSTGSLNSPQIGDAPPHRTFGLDGVGLSFLHGLYAGAFNSGSKPKVDSQGAFLYSGFIDLLLAELWLLRD